MEGIAIKEEFLYFLWKYKLFNITKLATVFKESVVVKEIGTHNIDSGPDFLNSQIIIGEQLWGGNVEIHVKSSDWYVHNHEKDVAYDAVILHVVWEYDMPVYREDGSEMSTLELQNFINPQLLQNYESLLKEHKKWILCEETIGLVDAFLVKNWMSRLYVERLEEKSLLIYELLEKSQNNWEMVLFQLLAKSFGMKVNGEAFLNLSRSFDFSLVRKLAETENGLEVLFLGQAGFLDEVLEGEDYSKELQQEYRYLQRKYKLTPLFVKQFQFFRLRPANFPTIRISQLASLYKNETSLFSKIIASDSTESCYELFQVSASEYWRTHYVFGKRSVKRVKKVSKSFVHLLLINTIMPLKYAYWKSQGVSDFSKLEDFLRELPSEKNGILASFESLGVKAQDAFESQALLQLKNEYCSEKKCLQCAIGMELIKTGE